MINHAICCHLSAFLFLQIMLICYGLIIQRLSQSKIRSVSVKSIGNQKKKPSSRSSKDRKRVTIMCAALVSCFLICWLPFHAIHLAKFIGIHTAVSAYLACLHDQNKSGFSGGPAFIQPIRAI